MKKRIWAGYLAALCTFISGFTTLAYAAENFTSSADYVRFGRDNQVLDEHKLGLSKSGGQLNQLALFVQFAGRDANSRSDLLSGYPLSDRQLNTAEHVLGHGQGSFADYIQQATNGQINLSTLYAKNHQDSIQFITVSGSREAYQKYHPITNPDGYRNEEERWQLEQTFLQEVASAANGLSFTEEQKQSLDQWTKDDRLDAVSIFIPGKMTNLDEDILAPHAGSGNGQQLLGKTLGGYVVVSMDNAKDGLFGSDRQMLGQWAHPFFHLLGLPDLYDEEDDSQTSFGFWDVMGDTHLYQPQLPNAYSSQMMGWSQPLPKVPSSATVTLAPEDSGKNSTYEIPIPGTSQQIILAHKTDGILAYRVNRQTEFLGNAMGNQTYHVYRQNQNPDKTLLKAGDTLGKSENTEDFAQDTLYEESGKNSGIVLSNIQTDGDAFSVDITVPSSGYPILTCKSQQTVIRVGDTFDPKAYIDLADDGYGNDVRDQVIVLIGGVETTALDTAVTGRHLVTYELTIGGQTVTCSMQVLVAPAPQPEDLMLTQNEITVQLKLSSLLTAAEVEQGYTLEFTAEPIKDDVRVQKIINDYLLRRLTAKPDALASYQLSLYKIRPGSRQLITQMPQEVTLTMPVERKDYLKDWAFLQIKDNGDFALHPVTVTEENSRFYASAQLNSLSSFTPLYGGNVSAVAHKGFFMGNISTGLNVENLVSDRQRERNGNPMTGDRAKSFAYLLMGAGALLVFLTTAILVKQEQQ